MAPKHETMLKVIPNQGNANVNSTSQGGGAFM